MFEAKTCHKCKEIKNKYTDFYFRNKKAGTYASKCKPCQSKATWESQKKKPEKLKLKKKLEYQKNINTYKNQEYKRKYGISLDDYNRLYKAQEGKCAICGKISTKRLHVDHCHKTKIVRGLLCHFCNPLLGNAKDSLFILGKAIEYLIKFKGEHNETS